MDGKKIDVNVTSEHRQRYLSIFTFQIYYSELLCYVEQLICKHTGIYVICKCFQQWTVTSTHFEMMTSWPCLHIILFKPNNCFSEDHIMQLHESLQLGRKSTISILQPKSLAIQTKFFNRNKNRQHGTIQNDKQ